MIELFSAKAGALPDPEYNAPPFEVGFRLMAIEVEDLDEAVEYLTGKGIEVKQGAQGQSGQVDQRPGRQYARLVSFDRV